MIYQPRKQVPYVILEYESLVVAGLKGTLERPLNHTRELIFDYLELEVAPLMNEPKRDFLALFQSDSPVVDLTFDQYKSNETAFVGYSLNKAKLLQIIESCARGIGFVPDRDINQGFKRNLNLEFTIDRNTYDQCVYIAEILREDLEKVFATVRYANFLAQYHDYTRDQAELLASRKFGINLNF